MDRVDVTIVGGGPVGLFAAFYAGMRGMSARIIDSLPELGGQLVALYPEKNVYDMPGFPEVLAKDLAKEMARQAVRFKPEVVLNETATTLTKDADGWTITGGTGTAYPTRTIIVSAGAGAFEPTKLGLAGEESWLGKGLTYGVQDKTALKGKNVVVVGGGDSAFDWALALEPVAASTRLVHRRDVFRAHEETVRAVQESSVEICLWETVQEIHGGAVIEAVTVHNTKQDEHRRYECDALVVNVGYKSSLGPLADWGMEIEKRQIKVDNLYRTNLEGVFAVGDVCDYEGKIKLIATGVGEATTAVCVAKQMLDPKAKLFPGHSSDMKEFQ
ncbi:MAG TPA: NAD(P)/FAD-dependent oxidoreductase [Fimbriimonadaceae bacterium]|nr:NAD(P)/FAD-dependent oxidoreductase [Fimbriimonadaceae bacterium]